MITMTPYEIVLVASASSGIGHQPRSVAAATDPRQVNRRASLLATGLLTAALLLPLPAAAQSFYASALPRPEAADGIGAATPASPGFAGRATSFVERGLEAQSLDLRRNLAGSSRPAAMRDRDPPTSFVERARVAQTHLDRAHLDRGRAFDLHTIPAAAVPNADAASVISVGKAE
jgi:hypothetical protein